MTVEQETSARRGSRSESARRAIASPGSDWTARPTATDVLKRLPGGGRRFVARAPGRLNVMGGAGDYAGVLTLSTTVADHLCVGAQRRTDHSISIAFARPDGRDGSVPLAFALTDLRGADGTPISAERGLELLGGGFPDHARCVLGVLVEMVRGAHVADLGSGLSIVVGSTVDQLKNAGGDAALAAAVLVAASAALDAKVELLSAAHVVRLSAICQRVQNHWLGIPVGAADAVGVLVGESHTLTQLRCDPCTLVGTLRLPEDLALVGIDCGFTHPEVKKRYERARTAAFVGRLLIERIIRHEGSTDLPWDGYLARISTADYVARFRDRLPTRLSGREILDRFGETGDPLTRIDPGFVYKVRSRSEHHIYEHARARQLVECLARAIGSADSLALAEAGELMYASHWSYGQRCGLGSVDTDLLVSLLRKHGTQADIFGAKSTGHGCGGVVAVLMRNTDRAAAALKTSLADYQTRRGHVPRQLRGSLPGALVTGAESKKG